MSIPQDPFMLLSYVNMKLRDQYPTLEDLCHGENVTEEELKKKLGEAGFEYMPSINQFR